MAANPFISLARMTISSSGTGNLNLNAAVSGFLTVDTAYLQSIGSSVPLNGVPLGYALNDTTASENGYCTYFTSGPFIVRGGSSNGLVSTNGGSPINASNAAQFFVTPMGTTYSPPTLTVITSTATTTFVTPTNATWLYIRMVGGGSGGQGSGATGGTGSSGGDTLFGGSLTAGGGPISSSRAGGGSASGGDINVNGSLGGYGVDGGSAGVAGVGGDGGYSPFGGAGRGAPGTNPIAASGYGSGGAGGNGTAVNSNGFAGAAGGYLEKLITNPSTQYSVTIGSGGTAGSAGGAGASTNGSAGKSGVIVVMAGFN